MIISAMNGGKHRAGVLLTLCFSLFVASPRCVAQNLVPNPSFEELDTCPYTTAFRQGDRPLNWYSWNATPEYFNACAQTLNGADTIVGVPLNGWGFQYAWDGDAYVGMVSFTTGSNYREYVGAELLCPMVVGRTYSVSFRVNSAEGGLTWSAGGGCNNIGALFTMDSNAWTSNAPIPSGPPFSFRDMAHVYSTEVINDTANWTLVSDSFEADSAYQFIVLGNFFQNALTDTTPSEIGFVLSYFLIDSVSVTSAIDDCNHTGVEVLNIPEAPQVYYDMHAGCLMIDPGGEGLVEYVVVDPLGKRMLAGKARGRTNEYTTNWPDGFYLLRTVLEDREAVVKFVVMH